MDWVSFFVGVCVGWFFAGPWLIYRIHHNDYGDKEDA